MDYLKLNENICRICLENDVILNWNDEIFLSCGMTYKDCYYKFTQISDNDSDCYPTKLCENCSIGLKNAHMLLEKALESYNILRLALDDNKYILPDEKALIEIDESPMYVNERNTDEISIREDMSIEPGHFLDIKNFETPLEQGLVESSNTESNNNKTIKKQKGLKALHKPSLEDHAIKSCNTKSAITKKIGNRRADCKSSTEIYYDSQSLKEISTTKVNRTHTLLSDRLTEKDNIKSCDTEPPAHKLSEQKPAREKLCQYCPLKVRVCHLKSHEATHNENRERKETCPQCGIKLYNKFSLYQHLKIHSTNRQKDHKCEFCEKAFFNKGALNIHRRIHLGLMVKCQICSKEYYRQVDLNKHLLTHSASPLQKSIQKVKYTVQCQYCNKSVLTPCWKEHKAAHLNKPQTKCKICDKDFFYRSSCKTHIQKVHGKRDFSQFIHYYSDSNFRMSHLMMVQQEKVQPLTK